VPAARTTLGDVHRLDPCSLSGSDTFAAYARKGSPVTKRHGDDYAVCEVLVPSETGQIAMISYDINDKADESKVARPAEGVTVEDRNGYRILRPGGGDPAFCLRSVVAADLTTAVITAEPFGAAYRDGARVENAPADWCSLAESAVDGMLEQIAGGATSEHRLSEGSLGRLRACTLLPASTLPRIEGLDPARTRETASGFGCFHGDPRGTYIRLRLKNEFPSPDDPDEYAVNIAGRPSLEHHVSELPGYRGASCDIRVKLGPTGEPGRVVEVVELGLSSPHGDGQRLCSAVERVAADVWPRLPKP
jgi:hypothetical protein